VAGRDRDLAELVLSGEIRAPYLLTGRTASKLQQAREAGQQRVAVSLDLGLSAGEVEIGAAGVGLPDGSSLAWKELRDVGDEGRCCVVHDGRVLPALVESAQSGRVYSLRATDRAPTILNSGFPMHRMQEVTPEADAMSKVAAVRPVRGRVLDTAMGLGYTAIAAARTADSVCTFEIDPAVVLLAYINPWSRPLFEAGSRIVQHLGDVCETVGDLPAREFDVIVHDPPTLALGGEMYSGAFYVQLARVLRRRGRLYHYVGDTRSAYGRRVMPGVIRRLREAGFTDIRVVPEAVGLVARP
jgi:predicted methyltransferase